MDARVSSSLKAAIEGFKKGALANGNAIQSDSAKLLHEAKELFALPLGFLAKVEMLDKLIDSYPDFDELREVFFDLLLVNFFSDDVKRLDANYLDSQEWEDIEEETLERGTELLNIFLYLRECEEEDIEPGLEDYLKEFLLVEDDEFQDELSIYEPVIEHQILMESSIEEIARISDKINPAAELKELFYPMMTFFFNSDPAQKDIDQYLNLSKNKAFDGAVLMAIIAYAK